MTAFHDELRRLAGRRCPDHAWLWEFLAPTEVVCFDWRRGRLHIPGPCLRAYVANLTDPAECAFWFDVAVGPQHEEAQ